MGYHHYTSILETLKYHIKTFQWLRSSLPPKKSEVLILLYNLMVSLYQATWKNNDTFPYFIWLFDDNNNFLWLWTFWRVREISRCVNYLLCFLRLKTCYMKLYESMYTNNTMMHISTAYKLAMHFGFYINTNFPWTSLIRKLYEQLLSNSMFSTICSIKFSLTICLRWFNYHLNYYFTIASSVIEPEFISTKYLEPLELSSSFKIRMSFLPHCSNNK